MKIQLDFDNKIIRLESQTNLDEFFKKIKTVLPDWKEWKLDSNATIYWNSPIIWDWRQPYWYNPPQVFYNQPTTSGPLDLISGGNGGMIDYNIQHCVNLELN